VLEGHLGNVSQDVLDLGILLVPVLAAEVVKGRDLVKKVVDDGDDNGDTDTVGPDDDDGDNVNPAITTLLEVRGRVCWVIIEVAGQPAEDTEDSGESVNTEDSTDQLPRRKRLTTTSNEDEPILGECDFQEEDFLDVAEVLHNATVGEEHSATDDPGTESK